MEKSNPKKWNTDNAKSNIENYCVYQERSHEDVRNKLLSHGIYGDFLEELISHLIETNFLNEERFAIQYAGGKFRIKKWGKVKIKLALKAKKVSSYSINEALSQIGDQEYKDTLLYWIQKKGLEPGELAYDERMALIRFLQTKGFEMSVILEVLKMED